MYAFLKSSKVLKFKTSPVSQPILAPLIGSTPSKNVSSTAFAKFTYICSGVVSLPREAKLLQPVPTSLFVSSSVLPSLSEIFIPSSSFINTIQLIPRLIISKAFFKKASGVFGITLMMSLGLIMQDLS